MKVKKEVTVAVIIGLLLGVIIVGGILRARKAIMNIAPISTSRPTSQVTPANEDDKGLFLTLETADNQVLKEAKLTVTGKTLPGTYIVINGEAGDSIIVPNDLGSFSQEVTLVKGANTILITVYQPDGTKKSATLNAVYTTAEI